MFSSLLVANRGEIACRIFKTASRMGVRTIAVYSEADVDALHVQLADEAVCIGPARASDSYLNIDRILQAAKQTGAQAIHPGYGFLSENAAFAQACGAQGIVFVGPPPEAIEVMGSKMASKQLMDIARVPILPGYHGDNQDPDFLAQKAEEVGFPLLIKASAGGGGKGMRQVDSAAEFVDALASAKREAMAAFSDDAVLLERFLTAPKHIEVQLMADSHGDIVHLFERDCSVQRRHQKVIEEAPGPTISKELRNRLGQTAIMAAKKVGYVGAGTVEFIAQDNEFFFMEMNTRLQVEHPITEEITGVDLVEMQLKVAAGEPLGITQGDLSVAGHAIEVRVYAEDPAKKFLPSTGELVAFDIDPMLRIDSGVRAGDVIGMHYDPMLAKIISHANGRDEAIAKLLQGLRNSTIAGVRHNLGYLVGMLDTPEFRAGDYTTRISDDLHKTLVKNRQPFFAVIAATFLLEQSEDKSAWLTNDGFRANLPPQRIVRLGHGKQTLMVELGLDDARVDEQRLTVSRHTPLSSSASNSIGAVSMLIDDQNVVAQVLRHGQDLYVISAGHTEKFTDLTDNIDRFATAGGAAGDVTSPMPGQVIAVHVKAGETVEQGQALIVVEAMKMEHSVLAPKAGTIDQVRCAVGERVEEGVELVSFTAHGA